jgi:hypothetical protein
MSENNPTTRTPCLRCPSLRHEQVLPAKRTILGMRTMQERAYAKRGEQYLLIKSPPASGKSRALMFIALDKLQQPGPETDHRRRAGAVHRRQLCR